MHQSPLLSLSLELVLLICDKLDLDDLKHLRLTCKSLAEGSASLVLHHISISARDPTATTVSELVSDLQSLSQPNNAFARCTREVTIGFLSIPEVDITDYEGQMKDALFKAITSLKSVDTVIWITNLYEETGSLQDSIWDAILSLGSNLLDLLIVADTLRVSLNNIESLNKLESITFSSIPRHDSASVKVVSAISKLYFSSSTLKSFTIRDEFSNPILLDTCSVHVPSGPSSLRHLDLTNCFIRFDEPAALSRLSNLTSLKYSIFPPRPDSKYSPDRMWTALKASEIQIEELDLGTSTMVTSLIDYLLTLSGLKKLRLNLLCSTLPTGMAARFWSAVFLKHINTLEHFALYAAHEGEWCFSPDNRTLIVQCTRLKVLELSISCQSEHDLLDDAKAIIDMAVTDMPCLEHLSLQVAGGIGSSDAYLRWINHEVIICNWIPTYEPPASCGHLPWLSVGEFHERRSIFSRQFGPQNRGMKLAYEEVKMCNEIN